MKVEGGRTERRERWKRNEVKRIKKKRFSDSRFYRFCVVRP